MSGHEQDTDIRDSTPGPTETERADDGMGVSSERVGHTGPGQEATDGINDTSAAPMGDDVPPEQAPGAVEVQPEGIAPAAGYPSKDPRSDDKSYKDAQR
jgi:hypothetical protein